MIVRSIIASLAALTLVGCGGVVEDAPESGQKSKAGRYYAPPGDPRPPASRLQSPVDKVPPAPVPRLSDSGDSSNMYQFSRHMRGAKLSEMNCPAALRFPQHSAAEKNFEEMGFIGSHYARRLVHINPPGHGAHVDTIICYKIVF